MKKLLTILFAALMVFSLAACNKNSGNGAGETPADGPEPAGPGRTHEPPGSVHHGSAGGPAGGIRRHPALRQP